MKILLIALLLVGGCSCEDTPRGDPQPSNSAVARPTTPRQCVLDRIHEHSQEIKNRQAERKAARNNRRVDASVP